MRRKSETQEFANIMFMLGQIETKANEDWANEFAISIRDYIVGLFNEGMEEDIIMLFDENGNAYFERKGGDEK